MAMHLFCHSTMSFTEAQKITDLLVQQHPDLFAENFLISQVREASAIQKEIGPDLGMDTQSVFLIRYNGKSAIAESESVIASVKSAFGSGRIIVLFENETLL